MDNIVDKELDEIQQERQLQISQQRELDESTYVAKSMETDFSKKMDEVKQNVLEDASEKDVDFQKKVKENVKQAAVKLTEVEKKKADYTEKQVEYESLKLQTKEQQEEHQQAEDIWDNRCKRRQYHYDGVKDLMEFMNIKSPMNLFFLYFFAIIGIVPFILQKLWDMTFGALLVGAQNKDRTKTAKAFIWTVIAVFAAAALFVLVYLFLLWRGIDIFNR